jgi:hydrogenase-4 component B
LNGFVSEFLIYLGIFKGFGVASGKTAAFLALAAPALALTGGLAVACFVKVYGCVFLGQPRAPLPSPHENAAMSGAMAILAGICIGIGVVPTCIVRLIEPVVAGIYPQQSALLPSILTTAHLYGISVSAAILFLVVILLVVFYVNRLKAVPSGETGTWDCGYAAPSASMQYSASSFAGILVGIFSGILRTERHEPHIHGLFPAPSRFHSHVPEVVLDKGIIPLFAAIDRRLAHIRRMQNGQLNRYILYIVVAVIVLLALSDFL